MRVAIDGSGHHVVTVTRLDGGAAIELVRPEDPARGRLHDALGAEVVARVTTSSGDRTEQRLVAGRAWISGAARALLEVGAARFAEIEIGFGGGSRLVAWDPLSPFETRFLADNGRPHPVSANTAFRASAWAPRTDLHSHFAACVSGARLVEIGARSGASFPPALLARMGAWAPGEGRVPIAELPPAVRAHVARHLSIPADRQTTFAGLEEVYARRAPITKHPAALASLLRAIADDYASMGVRYAELSLSNIVEAEVLEVVHARAPAIEAETGVTLRFLAALHRRGDLEWDLDVIDRLGELATSRYLVGIDFMGHETNSTRSFAPQLRAVCDWASRARPGFVVRVHAGENPAHPENVRVALELTAGADVEVRIGHGLYGVDDRTLDEIVRRGVIVEFNLGSNYALNNVQSGREIPLVRYLGRGVPVVLGTDGYGIYETTPALEARSARLFGATDADLERIRGTEAAYVARRLAYDAALPPSFVVPPDRPHARFTSEVVARAALLRSERDAALAARLASIGVPRASLTNLADLARGRLVISIAGAWRQSFEALGPDGRARVLGVIDGLLAALDPACVLLVAGGTRHGVEGAAQRAARRRGFDVLGVFAAATPPDGIDDALTHAAVVADTLYEKAGQLYPALRAVDAACVFLGGGAIVSDEIQTAQNLRARVHLLEGVEGASGLHAREQRGLAFSTAEELVRALAVPPSRSEPYRYLGKNPTVDVALVRGARGDRPEVLLVLRAIDAAAEAGKWALPGGFVRSHAEPGGVWSEGAETIVAAAVRELAEETGVDLEDGAAALRPIGTFERGGRDPRDTASSWSQSHAFALELEPASDDTGRFVAGGGDAAEAKWHPLDALPPLAFDHARIVEAVRARLTQRRS